MKITHVGIANATKAVARIAGEFASGEDILAPKELKEERFSICRNCEFKSGIQCSICECLIRAKTMIMSEKCPKGKW